MTISGYFVSKQFLERSYAPIFVKDMSGIYRYCNNAFADYLGLTKKDIIGKTAYDIFPKNLADIYTARDEALFTTASRKGVTKEDVRLFSHINDGVFNKTIIYENNEIAGFLCMINLHKVNLHRNAAEELKKLTHRELEVFNLLVKGRPVKEIAKELYISHYTIADHLKVIYRKLCIHSKNEAIYKGLHLLMIHPRNIEKK